MEILKQKFNIKDLEKLSGVKAHTIRIWERRYSILFPKRTYMNLRIYDIRDLQKILNISLLKDQGYKISRIAKLSEDEISKMIQEVIGNDSSKNRALNSFKIAMINFDSILFQKTFEDLSKTKTFSQIYHEVFTPLLEEIEILRQINSINPVHIHFLTGQLKEKLYLKIALLEKEQSFSNKPYVLFQPEFEIHELTLIFLNYELKLRKQKTIFLSPGLPLKELQYLVELYPNLIFVCYLTITNEKILEFLREFESKISVSSNKELCLLGASVESLDPLHLPSNIKCFNSITEFVGGLDLKMD